MKKTTFGDTGVEVAPLGMGCMRFQDPNDIDAMAEVCVRAHNAGVTYFDTAPFYCDDKSEDILGAAVKEMKRSGRDFQIATKCGSPDGDEVRRSLERSLERLNVDVIDFYHVWCLVHPHQFGERQAKGAINAFIKAKEEGLIRHICVSSHLAHDDLVAMLQEANGLFDSILLGLNAINFQMRLPGAGFAKSNGMGVVTMNTLGGGLLTEHAEHFEFIMQDGDSDTRQAAIRFNTSLPEVDVALVGFRNNDDVDTAVQAMEHAAPLTQDEIQETKRRISTSQEGFCTQCNYCDGCPEGIQVMRFMEAYNHRIIHDNPEAAIPHLKYYWGIPNIEEALSVCTRCGKCVDACTQHLPILERFEELKATAATVRERESNKD